MAKLYVETLGECIDITDEGRFELPSREYTAAELKKIAREVNRAMRESQTKDFDYEE